MTASTRNQDSTKVRTRTAPGAPRDSVAALAASRLGSSPPGAPPSNTAPSNDIRGETTVIRAGVDSLYLSYQGKLFEDVEKPLEEFKGMAQSEDPATRALAILKMLNHRFQYLGSPM